MTTTTAYDAPVTEIRELTSGTLVEVHPDGRAQVIHCDWLVRIPTGHPEPDSEADLWTLVECGGRTHYIENGQRTECESGHRHGWTPEAAAEEFAREETERRAWRLGNFID